MELTFTQCKQIAANGNLLETVRQLQDQPDWITEEGGLELADILSVQQGGCASGAFMPAVTYNTAIEVMTAHGTDIIEYLEDSLGELPTVPHGSTWGGICVHYYSYAVELWCCQFDLDAVNWD